MAWVLLRLTGWRTADATAGCHRATLIPADAEWRCDVAVGFGDEYLNAVVDTILRFNERTASIDPGAGTKWPVGFG